MAKSSALTAHQAPEHLAALRMPIALADDVTVQTTEGFARHVIRRVIAAARLGEGESGELRATIRRDERRAAAVFRRVVACGPGRLHRMSSARPWPTLPEEDRWAVDLMEELLADNSQTPEEFHARAKELHVEAAETDLKGIHDAALALAERYEQAAAACVGSS